MFESIIGYNSVKNELLKFLDIMVNPNIYDAMGIPIPKGILLYGPPGVGKTLCATELIKLSGRNSYTVRKDVDAGSFMKYIKGIFEEARKNAPSIIFMDDMDKFGDGYPNSEEYNVIQSEIDNSRNDNVFIVATSNSIHCFCQSLLRPGRFDRVIEVEVPSGEEAKQIIMHYLCGKNIDADVNMDQLAKMLDGHSCATLESIINMAGLYAGYERSSTIKMQHLTEAILSIVHDKPQSDFKDDYSYLVNMAYHEAGHVVVSEILKPGSVTLATIRQKHMYDNPFIISHNRIEIVTDVLNKIRICLAGKASVELKYGMCDIGASSDLNYAYSAMSKLISCDAYCGFDYMTYSEASNEMFNKADTIISPEINKLYWETINILQNNWAFVEMVTKELLSKETLVEGDIINIKRCLGISM